MQRQVENLGRVLPWAPWGVTVGTQGALGSQGHYHECYGVMLSPVGASWPLWALWGATVQELSLAPWEAAVGAVGCSYGYTQGAP